MELADSIEELKSTCTFCDRKAIMSLRHVDGVATTAGPVIELGAEDKYFPTCYSCYRAELAAAGESVEPRQTTNLKSAANC